MYRRSKLNNKLFKTMKKILVLFLFSVGCSLYAQQFSADMKKADIMKVCRCSSQMADQSSKRGETSSLGLDKRCIIPGDDRMGEGIR